MSFTTKDKIALVSDIPNKCQIPILNHRDDGELREVKMNKETCKVFSFKTLAELQLSHKFIDCDVAIAEDYFWTGMPFIVDGKLNKDEDYDIINSCVVASTWGTPCVITPDGDAYACYKEVPYDDFPGVYLKDWDPEFFEEEINEFADFVDLKIEELE